MKGKNIQIILVLLLFISSCNSIKLKSVNPEHDTTSTMPISHENLNGILWMQTSAEYDSLCRMIY